MNQLSYNPNAALPKTLAQAEYALYLAELHGERRDDRASGIRCGRLQHGVGFDFIAYPWQLEQIVVAAGSIERAERIIGEKLCLLKRNEARFHKSYIEEENAILAGDVDIEDVRRTFVLPPLPEHLRPLPLGQVMR